MTPDPRWPAALRAAREAAGLSLRRLATLVHYSRGYLHDLETGRKPPREEVSQRLAAALGAPALTDLLTTPGPGLSVEDAARMAYVTRHPGRVDAATVDILARLLDAYRRLEDTTGSAAVLRPVRAHLDAVAALVDEARDPIRPALVDVAAQWAQYAGWLHIATADQAGQRLWLGTALEWSTEVGNRDLAGTVLSFRGYAAEQFGPLVGPMVGLTRASLTDPDVYIGQRAYDQYQLARGLAYAGDVRAALGALSAGRELAAMTEEHAGPVPPWHYYRSPSFFRLEEGRAYAILARLDSRHADRAVELLAAGLVGADGVEWAEVYRSPLAAAQALVSASE